MKKQDILLIISVLVVALISLLGMNIYNKLNKEENITAEVYYDNTIILSIQLNSNQYVINYGHKDASLVDVSKSFEGIYVVPGTNGPVTIQVDQIRAMIKVEDEESPKHYCSIQGWTDSMFKPLTCLPNNLYIKIINSSDSNIEFEQ